MDLGFTKDPAWIKERAKLWKPIEADLKEEFSKQKIQLWKEYFFTGVVPKGLKIAPSSRVELFPSFTKEGIAYCLKKNISARLTDDEYFMVQTAFVARLKGIPGISYQEQLEFFRYVFGDVYDPARHFPFLIGSEKEHRKITLHPNLMYGYSASDIYYWLEDRSCDAPIWIDQTNYFYSLFPFLSKELFSLEEATSGYLEGPVHLHKHHTILRRTLRWCLDYPDPTKGAPEGARRRQYLKDLRDRMDNLDHYPGELKQLWESIKAEYP